jgi:hypothetical protein
LVAGLADHLAAEKRMLGCAARSRAPQHVRRATRPRP